MEYNIHLLLMMSDSEVKERVMTGWTRRKERVMPEWTKRPYGQFRGNCPRGPKLKMGEFWAKVALYGPRLRPQTYRNTTFLAYCDFSP
jgi:hypothetical protein